MCPPVDATCVSSGSSVTTSGTTVSSGTAFSNNQITTSGDMLVTVNTESAFTETQWVFKCEYGPDVDSAVSLGDSTTFKAEVIDCTPTPDTYS